MNTELIPWEDEIRVGGVNALAMGGVNTHIIVANYSNRSSENRPSSEHNVIPISATSEAALNEVKNA